VVFEKIYFGLFSNLVVLNDRINNKREGVNFQALINRKGKFYYSDVDQMLHHKFCIVDEKRVVTGLYNWTYHAESRNWENMQEITEPSAVDQYV